MPDDGHRRLENTEKVTKNTVCVSVCVCVCDREREKETLKFCQETQGSQSHIRLSPKIAL